jgi:hypothetical protein
MVHTFKSYLNDFIWHLSLIQRLFAQTETVAQPFNPMIGLTIPSPFWHLCTSKQDCQSLHKLIDAAHVEPVKSIRFEMEKSQLKSKEQNNLFPGTTWEVISIDQFSGTSMLNLCNYGIVEPSCNKYQLHLRNQN